jgi:hypothetical protein
MLNLLTDGSVDAVFCKTRAIGRCLAIQPKHPLSRILILSRFYLVSLLVFIVDRKPLPFPPGPTVRRWRAA